MSDLEQKILTYTVSHWQNNFCGISGIKVAEDFDIQHETALKVFDELEKQEKGSVRRDVALYQISISIIQPDNNAQIAKPKEIITSIFFPSKDILTESFYENEFHRLNTPEYKSRLLKGSSQTHLIYFKVEVLRKYLDLREIYDIESTVTGGYIQLNNKYSSGLSDDEYDKVAFSLIRFGKRQLTNENVTVTVILHDLSELSEKEQAYWYSYEIEDPQFAKTDPDFEIFFRRNFEAEFLNDNDPLEEVIDEINEINSLVGDNGLFTVTSNPYLSYPVVNTYKSFSDSCSELYKIIGSDSINEKKLKYLLQKHCGFSQEDFVHPQSRRPLGKLDLLKQFCKKINCENLFDNIEEIKNYRVSADHRVISPKITERNFITEYRRMLHKLRNNLSLLHQQIKKLELRQT
jgi:hypothetical protein